MQKLSYKIIRNVEVFLQRMRQVFAIAQYSLSLSLFLVWVWEWVLRKKIESVRSSLLALTLTLALFLYPERDLNPHKHYCSQDFKSWWLKFISSTYTEDYKDIKKCSACNSQFFGYSGENYILKINIYFL